MSRCFPFPPPGYEAKPRSEHKDLLKKEKHKEKKHKKERRGRERKEKNSNHRKDKHRKKHKREKHKDKRKSKDGDRYKNQISEKETQESAYIDNGRPKEKVQHEAAKDIKPANDLVTQSIDQGHHASHTGKLLLQSTKSYGSAGSKEKKRSLSSVVKKSRRSTHLNHGMIQQNYNVAYDNKKWKKPGLGSKSQVQNRKNHQAGSVEKHSNRKHSHNRMDLPQRSAEGTSTITTVVSGAERAPNDVITPSPNSLQQTGQVDQDPVVSSLFPYRKSGSMSPRGLMEIRNGSNDDFHIGMNQQLVQSKDVAVKGKGKTKELKTNDHKYVEDKDRDRVVMKRKAKVKTREIEKIGKVDVYKQEHKKLDSFRASNDKTDGLLQPGQLNEKFTSGDVKKRKDFDANSSLVTEHSVRVNKLPRISPINPHANGEIFEHSQGSEPSSSTVPVSTTAYEADVIQDSKECYNNGVTGSHHLKEPKTSVSSSKYGSNQVSLKPPHPDTKYLNQVYSIPAMDDCSDYIDQDWLLSRDSVERRSEILEAAQSTQVWAEAQLIDSADVVALPYVVPL
uniref:Uncharacterized protein n=1 Tax=Leersia perrieri TaxID=77586 RepID=A0A0D9XA01_9ORYZ